MDKIKIRKEIIEKRNALTNRSELDDSIYSNLINTKEYNHSKVIFTYVTFGSEVDTIRFIKKALKDKKIVCVPKTFHKNREMKVIKIEGLEDLQESSLGILEPCNGEEISLEEIDLIIMPGVAFDFEGNRIGYGAGYYDRYLANKKDKAIKIGIAYSIQIIGGINSEEHDIKIDCLITENGISRSNG